MKLDNKIFQDPELDVHQYNPSERMHQELLKAFGFTQAWLFFQLKDCADPLNYSGRLPENHKVSTGLTKDGQVEITIVGDGWVDAPPKSPEGGHSIPGFVLADPNPAMKYTLLVNRQEFDKFLNHEL